ncbi:alpha/beta hydrolase [Poseidonibacter lekithochrous]|uniref:alpha/beta fold hydrolase n=1 Tax=Poseidonibacter TaxID=2321187 RepID=UPI001C083581|nr:MULTISPECIES: alpha/beta hydrolase [Poseidonibacter]MBU3013695.1 alpha/beta hydrolase [Poseidonibacter lekithochrous]MDO6826992.1 alpha/beta hydrolase [Poseidonibacter sp. 1_MG-2023]
MKEKIYLIPGLMTDERLWSRIKPFLDEYELVHIPIPHSEDFDEILDILLDIFKEEKVNLLGFSLGGYIASYFAVTYPHRVNKLFMVAATPGASEEAEIERRREKFAVIEKEGFKGLPYEKAVTLVEEQNKDDIELIKTIQDMFMDLGKETFITQLTSTFNRVDLLEDLVGLKLNIWFYYSTKDRLLNHKSMEKLQKIEHNMTLISREGTSHNIPLESPKELSTKIKEWMSK